MDKQAAILMWMTESSGFVNAEYPTQKYMFNRQKWNVVGLAYFLRENWRAKGNVGKKPNEDSFFWKYHEYLPPHEI